MASACSVHKVTFMSHFLKIVKEAMALQSATCLLIVV